MTAPAIATAANTPARPRRPRRVSRQLLLTAHVLVSVGWNGVALGQLALAVTAALDGDIRHPAYELMHVFDRVLNIPLALLTLATGILISLRTRWGLLRHWWVVAKLMITVVAVLFAAAFMRTMIVRAGDGTADGTVHYTAPTVAIITGACLMNTLFITATFLSTIKPWGRTRRGVRADQKKADEKRSALATHSAAVAAGPVPGRPADTAGAGSGGRESVVPESITMQSGGVTAGSDRRPVPEAHSRPESVMTSNRSGFVAAAGTASAPAARPARATVAAPRAKAAAKAARMKGAAGQRKSSGARNPASGVRIAGAASVGRPRAVSPGRNRPVAGNAGSPGPAAPAGTSDQQDGVSTS